MDKNADKRTKKSEVTFNTDLLAEEKSIVVTINRVTKVVKGGKRFSFNALVVVGNGKGSVGVGVGKSNEVQPAITKATQVAQKNMISFPLLESSIPHEIIGNFGAGKVWMKPAVSGTGLIAGGGVRAVLEAGGVKNVLTKNLGTRNYFNSVYATMEALKNLKSKEEVLKLRGME
ncbi:MAG: 30S ribosomal protein S5 [Elusimicrobia bacterium]|nr:30S ribosomal protein S5 [Elusimicrobiota bacterium]